MYRKKISIQTNCGLHFFKELLNGKWKLMLIYYISQGFQRPGELQKKIHNGDRRVLDKQLAELVQHGFLEKRVYNTKVPKVEYMLTPLGNDLVPLIIVMEKWGEAHREELEQGLKNDPKFVNVF
ncbi:winged helix-turn-helix transcriptional regulator [Chitinophaga rhizophila]|uniref:Helix-turn-helix transcriptional regulator n=1 Tax=Chitinophaga rhizophila TaxID=2866212 RepID=A0ABS7G7F1_9BACT|nr:helix-turn-helix domain-containing protein [Chitinophaga rhizophila]MBW8683560.1 helix-turn-helix transcriptional regulator [Chitinophaga rhizophila]